MFSEFSPIILISYNSGRQRGLLLPDIEGIYTVERQLEIAKEKAGLTGYTNNEIEISYFSVTRYY